LISNIEEKITSFQHSIGIGASDHSLSLARFTQLYFHVGPAIKNNHRKLIPLNDQYEAGLLNVLRYFSENDFEDSLVENIDLVNFIENSIKFFEQANAASILLQRHNAICLSLIDNFSEKIVAIFGTGFPFYLVNDYGEFSHGTRTPKSILDYLYSQKQYFQSKLITEERFQKNRDTVASKEEIERLFELRLDRNIFDRDEYLKKGFMPPTVQNRVQTLEEFRRQSGFEIATDFWPCYYCSTLQFKDFFPEQNRIKITGDMCLKCTQTAIMLRNIMGCSIDLDIVVVVKDQKQSHAKNIKDFVLNHSELYLYDMNYQRNLFIAGDGPIDLFVTSVDDIREAFPSLLQDNWIDVTISAVALWSQTIDNLDFALGVDFPLAFEPRYISDKNFAKIFKTIRQAFAQKHSFDSVINSLRAYSLEKQQMLSNKSVIESIEQKLKKWRAY
jgi:hypothetical protein